MSPVAPMGNLGPCFVRWDPTGANIDLNPSNGAVHVRDALQSRDIFTDQHGDTPVDAVDMGRITEIDVPMTEFSLHQLLYVIDGATLVATKLTVKNVAGTAMLARSKRIDIKPSRNNAASAVTTEWTSALHCYPIVNQDLVFGKDDQRTVMVTFKVFPSEVTATLNEMFHYGPD